jgi:mannose-1-phosphate guanylyltransferase
MLGIVMAGGEGTRLRPLTLSKPKPMVTLLGRPVIDFVASALVRAGVHELVVTTGYRGEQLEEHIRSWNTLFSIPSRVNQESTPMGTAGSVRLLSDEIHETCIVGSGDSVASYEISSLLEAHKTSGAKVTMALWEVDDPTQYGIVGLSTKQDGAMTEGLNEGFITKFAEKPTIEQAFSKLINAGLYIIEPEVFDHIPLGVKYDFSKNLFPHLLEMGWPMYAKKVQGLWFDVGHPEELLKAQTALLQNTEYLPFMLKDGSHLEDQGYSLSSCESDSISASFIDEGCSIAAQSTLAHSYVMKGTSIGTNCNIQSSIIGECCEIGDDVQLTNCVVGDGVMIPTGSFHANQRIPQINS